MAAWGEAFLFGATVVAFVLGISSIIMGLLPQPAAAGSGMKEKVEYGFFGISALVVGIVLTVALVW
ncbi:hypothetical protein LJ739_16535 [Aestuariibacter halophilus]|uniref:Uncharacterized protein n=1 Tax=Fluctibacter halophilus TaxID=226011 RepID=A0ABS8GC90_9ALTE|nr:hypothetical protein [Aestuariibacter halophilus]MCC2617861.1 hypothetical protein [Aestuariibacter halophilus]